MNTSLIQQRAEKPLSGDLSKRERQDQIRELVVAQGFVRIDDLAAEFGVSAMTIHRDLDDLESRGWLRKVRGGATAQPSAFYHGDISHRLHSHVAEKHQLAQAALELIQPGQAIVLDDSTTALYLARLLSERGPVTAITNSLLVMRELAGKPKIDLVGLGGVYYPAYDAFFGVQTVEAAQALSADILFLSTTAITGGRCYHQSPETVQVKRALMGIAATRVLMVNHHKFNQRALHELASLTAYELMIVDSGTPPDVVGTIRGLGVNVEVAHEITLSP